MSFDLKLITFLQIILVFGQASTSSTSGVDCIACATEFKNAGGCECFLNEDCDVDALIPNGCDPCGDAALEMCNASPSSHLCLGDESECADACASEFSNVNVTSSFMDDLCHCSFTTTLTELAGSIDGQVPVDLFILMDATASMGESIRALTSAMIAMIDNIVTDVRRQTGFEPQLRVGVVGYRDPFADATIDQEVLDFTLDNAAVDTFLQNLQPQGGGDFPEDVNGGLRAILDQDWQAQHRFIVHISDAQAIEVASGSHPGGLSYRTLFAEINEKKISYIFGKLHPRSDATIAAYEQIYAVSDAGTIVDPSQAQIDVMNLQGKTEAQMAAVFESELVSRIVSRMLTRQVTQELGTFAICKTDSPSSAPSPSPKEVDNAKWNYCVSWGDPHIRPFNKAFYDDIHQDGERVFFEFGSIKVTTSQMRNIYNHRATLTGFKLEVDATTIEVTREAILAGTAFSSDHMRFSGTQSYDQWPRAEYPGAFSDMITFANHPDFAFFWELKGIARNGGYLNVGVRFAGDLDQVIGQCGPNPTVTIQPQGPEETCTALTSCCARYNTLDVLETSCLIDFKEMCCDENPTGSTACCEAMSPPDCTLEGCGVGEMCNDLTMICEPTVPTTTTVAATSTHAPLGAAKYCVAWGDPHLITPYGRFDDVSEDGWRTMFQADGVLVRTNQLRGVVNHNAVITTLSVSFAGLDATIQPAAFDVPAPLVYMNIHGATSFTYWPRSHYPAQFSNMITFPGARDVAVFWTSRGAYLDVGVKYTGDMDAVLGQCGPAPPVRDPVDPNPPTCTVLDTCCAKFANDAFNPGLDLDCKRDYEQACCPSGAADCCDAMAPPPCETTGCDLGETCDPNTRRCQSGTLPAVPTWPTIAPSVQSESVDLSNLNYCVSWGDPHIIRDDNSRFDDVRETGVRTFFEFDGYKIISKQATDIVNSNAANVGFEIQLEGTTIFDYNQGGVSGTTNLAIREMRNIESYAQWPRSRYPTSFSNMVVLTPTLALFWSHRAPHHNGGWFDLGVRYSASMEEISGQCGRNFQVASTTKGPLPTCVALLQCCGTLANNPFQPTLEHDCIMDNFEFCCGTADSNLDKCCGLSLPDTCDKTGCGVGEVCGASGLCEPVSLFPTLAPVQSVVPITNPQEFDYCVSWGDPHIITFDNRRFDDKVQHGERTFFQIGDFMVKTKQTQNIVNQFAVIREINVWNDQGEVLTIGLGGISALDNNGAAMAVTAFGSITSIAGALSYEQWPRSRYPTRFENMLHVQGADDFVVFWTHHGQGNARFSGGWFDVGLRYSGDIDLVEGQCGNFPVPTDMPTTRPDTLCPAVTACCGQFANNPFAPTLEDDCIADYFDECCVHNADDCCGEMRPPSCEDTGCDLRFEQCNTSTKMCEPLSAFPTKAPVTSNTCATFDCSGRDHPEGYEDPIDASNFVNIANAANTACDSLTNGCTFDSCCTLRNFGVDRTKGADEVCLTIDPSTLVEVHHSVTGLVQWCPDNFDCLETMLPSAYPRKNSQCVTKTGDEQTCEDWYYDGNRLVEFCETIDGGWGICSHCNAPKCRCLNVLDDLSKGGSDDNGNCYSRDAESYWCYTATGACQDGVTGEGSMAGFEKSRIACDNGETSSWDDPQDPTTDLDEADTDVPQVAFPTGCTSSTGDCNHLTDEDPATMLQVDNGDVFALTYAEEQPVFALRVISFNIHQFEAEFDDGSKQYFETDPTKDGSVVYYRLHPVPLTQSVTIRTVETRGTRRNLQTDTAELCRKDIPTHRQTCVAWDKVDITFKRCSPSRSCPENHCHTMQCVSRKCRDATQLPVAGTECGVGSPRNVCDGLGRCGSPRSCSFFETDVSPCLGGEIANPMMSCGFDTCKESDRAQCCVRANCDNTGYSDTGAGQKCMRADRLQMDLLGSIQCMQNGLPSKDCDLDQCCHPQLTCGASSFDCGLQRERKDNELCGRQCTDTECCKSATTCGSFGFNLGMCENNQFLKPNLDTQPCATTTCTADDCCGPEVTCLAPTLFAGCPANRARVSVVTTPCTDRDCSVQECCEPVKTCATSPVTCPRNREPQSPAANFECQNSVECTVSDCCAPEKTCDGFTQCGANRALRSDASTRTCDALTCTQDECCEPEQTCGFGFDCTVNGVLNRRRKPHTTVCDDLVCTQQECCHEPETCATSAVTCPAGTIEFSPKANFECSGTSCTPADCCQQSCSQFDAESGTTCGALGRVLDTSGHCANGVCQPADSATCCVQRTCANTGKTCPNVPAGRVLIDNPESQVCAGATCTDEECCKPAWGPWGTPGTCVVTDPSGCGNGQRTSTRTCVGSTATRNCQGSATRVQNCNVPCNPQEDFCFSWGDPHVNPFYSPTLGQVPIDCGTCGYSHSPQWQLYFDGTKNGKRIEIHFWHTISTRPQIQNVRVKVNGQVIFLYSNDFARRACVGGAARCQFQTISRHIWTTWNTAVTFPEFPELKIMWNGMTNVGIMYTGNNGVKSGVYGHVQGLCCHGNVCNTRRNLQASDLLPPADDGSNVIVDPTCPAQETCCQRYRNYDFLYDGCMVDALDACCGVNGSGGADCCVLDTQLGETCSTDADCASGQGCFGGICDDLPPPTADICRGEWSEYTSCDATCGYGKQTRTYTITSPASTPAGIQCPYEDNYVDERQCTRGPCGDVCDGVVCELDPIDVPCKETIGTCVDVSSQFTGGIRRAVCEHENKPDGTTCPEGVCQAGSCMFVLPATTSTSEPTSNPSVAPTLEPTSDPTTSTTSAVTSGTSSTSSPTVTSDASSSSSMSTSGRSTTASPAVNDAKESDTTDYKNAFIIVLGLLVVTLIALFGYICYIYPSGEDASKIIDVEMVDTKRIPELPTGVTDVPSNISISHATRDLELVDGETALTEYEPIILEMKDSRDL